MECQVPSYSDSEIYKSSMPLCPPCGKSYRMLPMGDPSRRCVRLFYYTNLHAIVQELENIEEKRQNEQYT